MERGTKYGKIFISIWLNKIKEIWKNTLSRWVTGRHLALNFKTRTHFWQFEGIVYFLYCTKIKPKRDYFNCTVNSHCHKEVGYIMMQQPCGWSAYRFCSAAARLCFSLLNSFCKFVFSLSSCSTISVGLPLLRIADVLISLQVGLCRMIFESALMSQFDML